MAKKSGEVYNGSRTLRGIVLRDPSFEKGVSHE
jgi:hypothetical protein